MSIVMKKLDKSAVLTSPRPVKIMQFGEGNFLRAFVDWMIDAANKRGLMDAGIVVVQPLEGGMVDMLKKQDCLYHVYLEGIKDRQMVKEVALVEAIQDAVNPYTEFEKYLRYALSDDLQMVISNTTEAGIAYHDDEDIFVQPSRSFPGKVTALLYSRFKHFNGDSSKGLTFICCELIERNASTLKEYVLRHATRCQLGDDFVAWVNGACTFCDTLVDRIVPGFPKENIDEIKEELGFDDNLVVKGEYYHVWAIAGNAAVQKLLPLDDAGLHVLFMDDIKPFRDKKVRILNGSHTALVPVALQLGFKTVKEAFDDADVEAFVNTMVAKEVLPAINEDPEVLSQFADSIIERFYNPAIRHYLETISLNSLSKWETRNYPTLKDGFAASGVVPPLEAFSLAALLVLYSGKAEVPFSPNDTKDHVEFIQKVWDSSNVASSVEQILANRSIWKEDFTEIGPLCQVVASFVSSILTKGMREALKLALNSYKA